VGAVIVAHFFGGPRDGLVAAVQEATPIVFPVVSYPTPPEELSTLDEHIGNMANMSFTQVVYVPRRDTYKPCTCIPGCPHATMTYYVSGWGQ
jgi:hypothetical protein